ncbi:hypothetical protein [Streptomyces maremycinicus]|uniref:hypothetical protein n=1 Tax=Streptomyces maremycinicus TaxID=1679753 RepID=UPI00078966E1|nr:hypothetical protein [Streptomyces sp. NBRC 110468]
MDRPPPAPPRAECPSGLLHAALWADRPGCRVPIYARLVAEWRAHGRTVPTRPDVPWVPSSAVRRLRRDEDGTFRP